MIRLLCLFLLLLPVLATGQTAVTADSSDNAITLAEAEVKPQYPGGDEALMKFFADNIVYGEIKNDCFGSKIIYTLIIDTNGVAVNPEAFIRGCPDNEILQNNFAEIILKMPHWTPGNQNGKKVKVKMVLPVNIHFYD